MIITEDPVYNIVWRNCQTFVRSLLHKITSAMPPRLPREAVESIFVEINGRTDLSEFEVSEVQLYTAMMQAYSGVAT